MQRLRQNAGSVHLADARDYMPDTASALIAGLDIDEGMLVFYDGKIYEGGDAVHIIALLSGKRSFLTRLLFSHRWVTIAIYPVLRAGRNLALRLLGRQKLN